MAVCLQPTTTTPTPRLPNPTVSDAGQARYYDSSRRRRGRSAVHLGRVVTVLSLFPSVGGGGCRVDFVDALHVGARVLSPPPPWCRSVILVPPSLPPSCRQLVVSPAGDVHDQPRGPRASTCACFTHERHSHRTAVLGVLLAGARTSINVHAWHEPDLPDQRRPMYTRAGLRPCRWSARQQQRQPSRAAETDSGVLRLCRWGPPRQTDSLREGSHRGLTATVFLHPNALLPVHPGGGIQGAFPLWRPLVVISNNNNKHPFC